MNGPAVELPLKPVALAGAAFQIAARPDHPARIDGDVLGDVGETALLGVEPEHALDRLDRRPGGEVGVVRAERVVHVDLGDPPIPGKLIDQRLELFQRQLERRV